MRKKILIFLIVFLIGWFSSAFYSSFFNNHETDSYSIDKDFRLQDKNGGIGTKKNIKGFEKLFGNNLLEKKDINSPYDWIKPEQIFVYDDKVVIKIQNPEWSIFTDTKSMDPTIDSTSNAIEIIPKSENDVHIGDIAAYKSKYNEGIVAHRVVSIDYDASGWYAILKGDNNDYPDPGRVRFEQIKRVLVAIIY